MTQIANAIPTLPCPNCGANILQEGFHNTCSETVSLREDNRAYRHGDLLYVDHDESGHETVDHECDTDAYCCECDELLPWALYEIRRLDGASPVKAEEVITELLRAVAGPENASEQPAA
jgi:hypothetical protein